LAVLLGVESAPSWTLQPSRVAAGGSGPSLGSVSSAGCGTEPVF